MDKAGDFTEVTDFVENGKLFVGVQSTVARLAGDR